MFALVGAFVLASSSITASNITDSGMYAATEIASSSLNQFKASILHQQGSLSFIDITMFLRDYTQYYGVSYDEMYQTLQCESKFNVNAVNPSDPSYGIAQFVPSTFYYYAPKALIEYPDIDDTQQQLQTMAWMFAHGLAKRWTCYRKLFPSLKT